MVKMPICRICLAENVRMYLVVDKNLQELYEKLTDIPFVTEDRRSMLACFLCFAKLKQCCQLQRKCLEAEELFAQMMNEPNPSVNRGQLKYSSGLTVTPVENISIVDVSHIESIAVKEELPAVCERLDDVIEPGEEHQSDDLKLENVHVDYSNIENTLAYYESNSKDGINTNIFIAPKYDVPLTQFKTEVEEEQEVSSIVDVSHTENIAVKEELPAVCERLDDVIEPGEEHHSAGTAVLKKQKLCIRGKKLEDVIAENQKKNKRKSATRVIQNIINYTPKLVPNTKDCLSNITPRDNISIINTTLDTDNPNDIKKPNLLKHLGAHTEENSFKCDVCQSCFSQKELLTNHICMHTSEKLYNCEEYQTSHLTRHIPTLTGDERYRCERCRLCFALKSALTRHMRTHTGEKPYKCEECGLCFNQKIHLTTHIRTHTGEKPFKCEECKLYFSHKTTLTFHVRTHTGEKPYKCRVCQLCFSRKSSLTTHIRIHSGEKPYECEECHITYNHKTSLARHMRTHTGEKPYNCEECHVSFNHKTTLARHMRTHTGEKPYKCEECQLCFSHKGNLTIHTRTHTGEKPYKCEKCQCRFNHRSHLTKHISRRHVEKPYKCDDCPSYFDEKAHLSTLQV